MKVTYIEAIQVIHKKDFPCYVITGKEPFQKNKLVDLINQKYKAQQFEILRTQITNQQYDFLQLNYNTFSLFAEQRLLQLHISKAPDKNAQKLLTECVNSVPQNDRYLLVFEDLNSAQQKTKWFQTIIQNALYVQIWPVSINEAMTLIKLELTSLKTPIKLTQDALMLLAQKTEGNLFAASQIISLLQDQPEKSFDQYTLSQYLSNAMSYDVFDLSQSIVEQNINRSLTILQYLFKERIETAIILWAIVKEVRIWLKLSTQTPQQQQSTFVTNNIWRDKQIAYQRLIKKFHPNQYSQLLNKCFMIDLMIKGIESGNVEKELNELICQLHH